MNANSLSPLNVAFVWHMHQPYYKDVKTNRYLLPWVRLHALKDYYDMVAILDNHPGISVTFNLVPTLIEQLQDYASNSVYDRHLFLTEKKAEELTPDEKLEIVRDFFMGNQATMIKPYARYYQLLVRRERTLRNSLRLPRGSPTRTSLTCRSGLIWFGSTRPSERVRSWLPYLRRRRIFQRKIRRRCSPSRKASSVRFFPSTEK